VGRAVVRIRQAQDALDDNDRAKADLRLQQAVSALLDITLQDEAEAAAEGWIEIIMRDAQDPETWRIAKGLFIRSGVSPQRLQAGYY
jgi:hypothetical protein